MIYPIHKQTHTGTTLVAFFELFFRYLSFLFIIWSPSLFHLVRIGVGSDLLASHSSDNIDVTTVVLQALLGSSSGHLLLVFLGLNLWGLSLNLTGTSQRSVNFSHCIEFEIYIKLKCGEYCCVCLFDINGISEG